MIKNIVQIDPFDRFVDITMVSIIKSQKQQQDTDQSGLSSQFSLSNTPASSTDAKIDQLMDMMRGLITRMDIMEARSRPITFILSSVSIAFASSAPQSQSIQSITVQEDKRWRPEEIGYFDGIGDVYAFVDRLSSIATNTNRGVKLI